MASYSEGIQAKQDKITQSIFYKIVSAFQFRAQVTTAVQPSLHGLTRADEAKDITAQKAKSTLGLGASWCYEYNMWGENNTRTSPRRSYFEHLPRDYYLAVALTDTKALSAGSTSPPHGGTYGKSAKASPRRSASASSVAHSRIHKQESKARRRHIVQKKAAY